MSKQENISRSELSIYDEINYDNNDLWYSNSELEKILNENLIGFSLNGLALRTRSKVIKSKICEILGYPIPKSFLKTQPRFYGQNFDIYVQKSNNLQIWNEDIDINRRYVLIRITEEDIISKVVVISGLDLQKLDTTGTLTQKFQARIGECKLVSELFCNDTDNIKGKCLNNNTCCNGNPCSMPTPENLLPITAVFKNLTKLLGKELEYIGEDQERNRGAVLHKLICKSLGYENYQDDGQFPDIPNQLIEIKLQTSPTIDLGLILPTSESLVKNISKNFEIRHCDIRYVIFVAQKQGNKLKLTNLIITTGQEFFNRFTQFQGKVVNKKIQIPLPTDFFETKCTPN